MSNRNEVSMTVRETISKLIFFIKPFKLLITLGTAATMINIGSNIYLASLVNNMTDDVARFNEINKIYMLMLYMFVVIAVCVVSKYMMRYFAGRYTIFSIMRLQEIVIKRIEKAKIEDIEKNKTGDIISQLTRDSGQVEKFFENDLLNFFYQPLVFSVASIYLFSLNKELLLIILLISIFVFLFSAILTCTFTKFSEEIFKSLGESNVIAKDMIDGFNILKAFNMENRMSKKYSDSVKNIFKKCMRLEVSMSFIVPIFTLLDILPIIICIVAGGYLVSINKMSLGSLLSFLFLLDHILSPTKSIPSLIQNFNLFRGAAKRIFLIVDLPQEKNRGADIINMNSLEATVEFEKVGFSYTNKFPVLNDISFSLKNGKITAIVGASGCGKSTIVNLICRFLVPNQGIIKINGQNINEYSIEATRERIALVGQDTYLFPTTIAENISYGRRGATIEEIIEAAKSADIHEFINGLPNKYETLIGEGKLQLSGGQTQRLSIARAILSGSEILILDEPTSALDSNSEKSICKLIVNYAENHTVLIISHKLSTIKLADNIVVIEHGRIVENGSHQELIKNKGTYWELFKYQLEDNNDLIENSQNVNGKEVNIGAY